MVRCVESACVGMAAFGFVKDIAAEDRKEEHGYGPPLHIREGLVCRHLGLAISELCDRIVGQRGAQPCGVDMKVVSLSQNNCNE